MLTVQYIAQIIKSVMALETEQIWIYNQRRLIPNSKGLFVIVGMVDSTPYGTNRHTESSTSETRTVHTKETISIDLISHDLTAPTRLPELIGSLHSTYGEEIQQKYGFKLAANPTSVLNTSEVEGSSMIHRFTVTTTVLRAYDNTSPIAYYDSFSLETFTEEGQA